MCEDKIFEFSKLVNCLIFCDVDVYSFATLGEGDKLYSEGNGSANQRSLSGTLTNKRPAM